MCASSCASSEQIHRVVVISTGAGRFGELRHVLSGSNDATRHILLWQPITLPFPFAVAIPRTPAGVIIGHELRGVTGEVRLKIGIEARPHAVQSVLGSPGSNGGVLHSAKTLHAIIGEYAFEPV